MVKKRNYINNHDLTEAIVSYQKSCRKQEKQGLQAPIMPKYLGECIMSICNRLTQGFNFNFSSYSYRDEMIADAIERCIYAVRKFNYKKSTSGAFSYLTTVAVNAQKNRIKNEKKQNYIKHKYFQAQFMNQELEGMEPNEMSDKVVQDYEEKAAAKKSLTNRDKHYRISRKRKVK